MPGRRSAREAENMGEGPRDCGEKQRELHERQAESKREADVGELHRYTETDRIAVRQANHRLIQKTSPILQAPNSDREAAA